MQPDATVLERISDGVFVLDQDWYVVFINSGGAKLVRRSAESLHGKVFWEQFPEAVGSVFEEQYRRAMRRQEPGEFEALSPSLGRWFSIRMFPSADALTLVLQDVTQRREADDAIRRLLEQLQRQRRLATVLAETNEVVFRAKSISDLFHAATSIAVEHGGFVMSWIGVLELETGALTNVACAGDGAEEYLRDTLITARDEPIGRGTGGRALRLDDDQFSVDILSDIDMAPWRDAAIRVGYRSSGALPLRINGEIRGLLSVYAREPSYFNDDERNLVHRLAANVSYGWEALQREENLRESEVARRTGQRFRAILSAAPDAMLAVDLDGRIETANERVHSIFGCSAEEIIGMRIHTLIVNELTGDSPDNWFDQLRSSDSTGTIDGLTAVRRDGSRFSIEVARSVVLDEVDDATIIVSVHDLTERLELEES
jgi:PAS domain S-box-containing protein